MSNGYQRLIGLLCLTLLLSACLSNTHYAPVVNAWQQPGAQQGTYIVHKGDTIYSIAWTFSLDYRALAAANGLGPPYEIRPGQRLQMQALPRQQYVVRSKLARVNQKRQVVKVYHVTQAKRVSVTLAERAPHTWPHKAVPHWVSPAYGKVVSGFSSNFAGNRGIDIAGRLGEPIRTAAAGRVVYSGDGVRGYGNLLIVKHNDSYLSAYAYNKRILVTLGQWVRAGQVIAKMGRNNAGRVMLHFEIRRNGKPVNPERYIHS